MTVEQDWEVGKTLTCVSGREGCHDRSGSSRVLSVLQGLEDGAGQAGAEQRKGGSDVMNKKEMWACL